MNDTDVAARLAEALAGFFQTDVGPLDLRAAAALLPVVREIADQRAAEELEAEAAYDDLAPDEVYPRGLFARRLRVRAANLRRARVAALRGEAGR